jgi:dTDP-4-amino-4,6-dideoxygalactose transaminase
MYLKDKGIETKIHYEKALSEYPISMNLKRPDMMSTSIMLTRGLLSLPIYPELSDAEVEYVAQQVKNFFTSLC